MMIRALHRGRIRRTGFTFIELLVYIAIVGTLVVMVVSLFFALAKARMRQESIAEVEQQGAFILSTITTAVRNAQLIQSPAPGVASTSITLTTSTSSTDPTTFAFIDPAILSSLASGTPSALSSLQVVASNVLFQNVTATGTSGSIKVSFTLSHASSSRYDSQYSATFIGSATIRKLSQ